MDYIYTTVENAIIQKYTDKTPLLKAGKKYIITLINDEDAGTYNFSFETLMPAKSAEFEKENYVVGVGKSIELSLKTRPQKTTDICKYESSNKSIATVDKNGKITGKKKGTTYITATFTSGVMARTKISVN